MRIHRLLLSITALLVVAACSDVAEPAAPEIGPLSAVAPATSHVGAQASATQHRVTGSGHVEAGDGIREFTFHAVERPDGSVDGSYKIVLPNGLFFEADVTCVAVNGDTGWVAGVIRDTNAGIIVVGSTTMFYATDGGEGADATDVVSVAAFNGAEGADLAFCEDQPQELAPMTVTQGNVQVR